MSLWQVLPVSRCHVDWRLASTFWSVAVITERATSRAEQKELSDNPVFEHDELTDIYVKRGLDSGLAKQVATQLMSKDALATHLRDELGISQISTARPVQAALTSAATFAAGAALPLLVIYIAPQSTLFRLSSLPRWFFLPCCIMVVSNG